MSSIAKQLIGWFQSSPAVAAAKKDAVAEITDAATKLLAAIEARAPDMIAQIDGRLADVVSTAVAGALTKK